MSPQCVQEAPTILVISFCDGIGAVLQAAVGKWGPKARLHAWEIIPEATTVCGTRAPHCTHHGDLKKLTSKGLWALLNECKFTLVLVAAGFPCQDTSKVRGKRRPGLKGRKSSLVFAIIAIIQQIRKLAATLPSQPDVHVLLENVMGVTRQDALKIAATARTKAPICIDAKEMS